MSDHAVLVTGAAGLAATGGAAGGAGAAVVVAGGLAISKLSVLSGDNSLDELSLRK